MIEVTIVEIALFVWGILMTAAWLDSRRALTTHKVMTMRLFEQLAKGSVKIVDNGDSFEFKEV